MMRDRGSSANLHGLKVLILEDEFYLAAELQEQVGRAGGIVLGPCPDTAAGMAQLDADPDCAIVDINLGRGPSFEVAAALQQRGIPFFFLTGYDMEAVPSEFVHVSCLQKPAAASRVIDLIARLTGTGE